MINPLDCNAITVKNKRYWFLLPSFNNPFSSPSILIADNKTCGSAYLAGTIKNIIMISRISSFPWESFVVNPLIVGEKMADDPMIVELENSEIIVAAITGKEYYDCYQKSISILHDYFYQMDLNCMLRTIAPNLIHPRLYAALKSRFGETTTMYDNYKCSFGYQFLVVVMKKKASIYTMNFNDYKGGLSFCFMKVLNTPTELEKYRGRMMDYHEPFEDEFSKPEMCALMRWFVRSMSEYEKNVQEDSIETFARSNDYCQLIYGRKNKEFFLNQYEEREDFDEAKDKMIKKGKIPFNKVKEN